MVTGGTGSIGASLVQQVLAHRPASIRVLTNDEDSLHRSSQQWGDPRIRYLLGDVRSKDRMRRAMKEVDVVFHAAALKHVPFCEYNPFEAVEVNVMGTQNVVDAALDAGVDAVVGVSTDKAVNPVNTMGATKLLSEKLVLDANNYKGRSKTRFWCARFGNVVNSRGSIVPVVHERIRSRQPVEVTDPGMTRFILPIETAAKVVVDSVGYCKGGEVVVPAEMAIVRIGDLVKVLVQRFARLEGLAPASVDVRTVGARAGEKMHEMLFTDEEMPHVRRRGDAYVLHAGQPPAPTPVAGLVARSDQGAALSEAEIAALLDRLAIGR